MVFTKPLQKITLMQMYNVKKLILIKCELDRLRYLKSLFHCSQFIYILQGEALTVGPFKKRSGHSF